MRAFLCGTPEAHCSGSAAMVNWRPTIKVHKTRGEAFRCHKRYLLREGYKQIGPREFLKQGEPVILLNKQSHFGGVLRGGKREKQEGHRYVPKTSGERGGLIFG